MSQFFGDSSNNNQTQVVAVLILLAIVSLIIGGLYLAQSTTNITTVRDIEELRRERNALVRDNEALRAQIAGFRSIDNLMTRAADLGFENAQPEDIQYLIVDNYVYRQPTIIPTPILPTPTSINYDENFSGWLTRQIDALRDQFKEWTSR